MKLIQAGYVPHEGLTIKETKYLGVAEALHKLKWNANGRRSSNLQAAQDGRLSDQKEETITTDSKSQTL